MCICKRKKYNNRKIHMYICTPTNSLSVEERAHFVCIVHIYAKIKTEWNAPTTFGEAYKMSFLLRNFTSFLLYLFILFSSLYYCPSFFAFLIYIVWEKTADFYYYSVFFYLIHTNKYSYIQIFFFISLPFQIKSF